MTPSRSTPSTGQKVPDQRRVTPLRFALYLFLFSLGVGCEGEEDAPPTEMVSGEIAEEIAGERAGESVEETAGESAEEVAGDMSGESAGSSSDDPPVAFETASCSYVNLFSSLLECKTYVGEGWSAELVEEDCAALSESALTLGEACDIPASLGECHINEGAPLEVAVTFPGDDEGECSATAQGCTLFAEGRFEPSALCEGVEVGEGGIGSGGTVFQPFELICFESEEPGGTERCTWQAIGGCAPEGERYLDYAACGSVLTQRPYAPVPPSGFETPADDPLREDPDYLREVEWVRSQAESCGCVCCHSESVAPRGASVWDTEREGIWTDSFTPTGLAQGAGWLDTSVLGAFPESENNGFNREVTVLPTTNVERMVNFFSNELARRGYTEADFEGDSPIGGPLYSQRIFEPTACELGEGVNIAGEVYWSGGRARYVYVLEEGSDNPSTPPNLDLPEGVIWRLDVDHRRSGIKTGITYGVTPRGTSRAFPTDSDPTTLEEGRRYYLYVLQDIAIPITRCLFTYGEVETGVEGGSWGDECGSDEDCGAPSDFCAKMPGSPTGYCTAHCGGLADCEQYGTPDEWSCNALTCDNEQLTWCGPRSEIAESNGFLSECL